MSPMTLSCDSDNPSTYESYESLLHLRQVDYESYESLLRL